MTFHYVDWALTVWKWDTLDFLDIDDLPGFSDDVSVSVDNVQILRFFWLIVSAIVFFSEVSELWCWQLTVITLMCNVCYLPGAELL